MTFLLDFINDAQGETSVKALLRKLKTLAVFTDTPELKKWADLEIGGYPSDASLIPAYRGPFPVLVLGHFRGFVNEIKNFQIPPSTFPEKLRDTQLFNVHLIQGVAEIEGYAASEQVEFAWSPDAVRAYNAGIHLGKIQRCVADDCQLLAARFVINRSQFEGVLDAIQNKALDLALELYPVAPEAGEPDADMTTNEAARSIIKQYIITYNLTNADLSGSNNAFGSNDFGQGS